MKSLYEQTYRYSTPPCDRDVVQVGRPSKLKAWDDYQMERALNAVMTQELTIRRAAETYAAPKSTLADRVSGHVKPGSHSGPERYLTDEEEKGIGEICT